MASSKRNNPGEVTIKGVLAYAMRLRTQANAARIGDPHVELYAPSADTARKLCSQLGPAGAMNKLAERARMTELRYEQDEARAHEGRERLRGLQLVVAQEERSVRDRLSWGQRLDAALLAANVQSDVSAAVLDGDVISGGKPSSGPPPLRRDRVRENAIEDVKWAVEALERELDRARRRMLNREVRAA